MNKFAPYLNSTTLALVLLAGFPYFLAQLPLSDLPIKLCQFRELAKAPCPLCGGTSTLQRIGKLEWRKAASTNPGIFLAYPLALILLTVHGLSRFRPSAPKLKFSFGLRSKLGILAFTASNWIYLLLNPPK
jgi:hypothetical protein